MRLLKTSLIAVGAFLALALAPSAAWSQCTVFVPSPPDGRITENFVTAATSNETFFMRGLAGRSYSVEVLASLEEGFVFHFGAVGNSCPTADDAIYRNTSAIAPQLFDGADGQRMSFIAPSNGFYLVRVENNGSSQTFRYSAVETTLYNPLWSTAGGFETFYRFQNTTNDVCNVTLTMRNDAGALVGGTPVTFPIPANSTVPTRNTGAGDLNVGNGLAGNATISHDCPPGGVQVDGFTAIFGASTAVLPIKIVGAREALK